MLFHIAGADRPVTPVQIATALDIPRPSVYRLVATLESEGLVTNTGKGLVATPRFFFLSAGGRSTATLAGVAEPWVAALAEATGETAGLQVRVGKYRRCIVSVEGTSGIRWAHDVGYTAPVWAGANGHVLMAALSENECSELISSVDLEPIASGTILDPDVISERVAAARARGWSMSVEEVEAGAAAIAVPVAEAGRTVAVLNLYAPTSRAERLPEALPDLRHAASKIGSEWERVHGPGRT